MEIRFLQDPNDYLLYGLTEEMLYREGSRWLQMDLKSLFCSLWRQTSGDSGSSEP